MAVDLKYGEITADNHPFHPGEPLFVLRAQDRHAPETLRRYYVLCLAGGADNDHLAGIEQVRDRFIAWQSDHPDLVKTPDTKD